MRPLYILLAMDSPDVFVVRLALEEHQVAHQLHVVSDGEEAIQFISRMGRPGGLPCPDVLLLDLNLPKADGTQVLGELRRHPECAATPVIVVTSSGAARFHRARLEELGVSRCFAKPADIDGFLRLGAVVREVVGEVVE